MDKITVVSYPKCGRTWLRLMLGRIFTLHFRLVNGDLLELDKLASQNSAIPTLVFTHDGPANLKTAAELLIEDKQIYANQSVILLVRDPADVVVSYYFEQTRRRTVFNPAQFQPFRGDLSAFLHEKRGGLDSIIAFYQNWAVHCHVPASLLLVRYEDMHSDTSRELRRVVDFVGLSEISDEVIGAAAIYGRFDNMRQLEQKNGLNSERLRPGNPTDLESYKTRRGCVGGFRDYLSPDDIAYVLEKRRELPPFYGYG